MDIGGRTGRRDFTQSAELSRSLFLVISPAKEFQDGRGCLIAPEDLSLANVENHSTVIIRHNSHIIEKGQHVPTSCRWAAGHRSNVPPAAAKSDRVELLFAIRPCGANSPAGTSKIAVPWLWGDFRFVRVCVFSVRRIT
jgi:hypothetical protein